jgi:hypothetical protein
MLGMLTATIKTAERAMKARKLPVVRGSNYFNRTVAFKLVGCVTTRFLLWGYMVGNAYGNNPSNIVKLNPIISDITGVSGGSISRLHARNIKNNDAVSKVDNEFISHPTRAHLTLSAANTIHVSHELPPARFSCSLRGRGTSFQDGVPAGEGFLRVLF